MRYHWENNRMVFGLIGYVLVAVTVITLLIVWAVKSDNEYATWCEAQGGHVDSTTQTGVGSGINPSNGQVTTVVTSNTTTFCLSEDGRVLDIRGS